MTVLLRQDGFDPWDELRRYQTRRFAGAGQLGAGQFGATASFVGAMRDFNQGDAVLAMELEHYPGMTEQALETICAEAGRRWRILDALIIHRVGNIRPNDPIVLAAVWSAHRAAAFDACRYLMEQLKSTAPFWKKETLAQGERWVAGNTPG